TRPARLASPRKTQKPPHLAMRRLRSSRATHGGRRRLPEKVVNHVDDFAGVCIHEQHVVVVADPAIRTVDLGQAVLPRIADPVAAAEEQRIEDAPDPDAAIAVVAVRRVIRTEAEHDPVTVAITLPIIAVVVTPATVPAPVVAPVVATPVVVVVPAAVIVLPAIVVAAVRAPLHAVRAIVAALLDPRRALVATPICPRGALVAAAIDLAGALHVPATLGLLDPLMATLFHPLDAAVGPAIDLRVALFGPAFDPLSSWFARAIGPVGALLSLGATLGSVVVAVGRAGIETLGRCARFAVARAVLR